MVVVESPNHTSDPVLSPWVRVARQEANPPNQRPPAFRHYAIDAVHIDAFERVLCDHIMPLAKEFAARTEMKQGVLLCGGRVADLDHWVWDEVQPLNER
jgi:hypothetical protein